MDDLVAWLKKQIHPQTESRSARELLNVYFEEYLAGLPHEGLRRTMQQEGLDKAKEAFHFCATCWSVTTLAWTIFYVRQHLSDEDYAFHRSAGAGECSRSPEEKE